MYSTRPFYIWAFVNFQIWNVSHSKILLFEILTPNSFDISHNSPISILSIRMLNKWETSLNITTSANFVIFFLSASHSVQISNIICNTALVVAKRRIANDFREYKCSSVFTGCPFQLSVYLINSLSSESSFFMLSLSLCFSLWVVNYYLLISSFSTGYELKERKWKRWCRK